LRGDANIQQQQQVPALLFVGLSGAQALGLCWAGLGLGVLWGVKRGGRQAGVCATVRFSPGVSLAAVPAVGVVTTVCWL
jgi:hypothetical protein